MQSEQFNAFPQDTSGKRTRRRASVALVAVLAGAVAAVSAAPAMAAKHRLQLVANQNYYDFLDIGAPGNSLGDQLVFGEVFTKRGDEVGKSGVVCTVTAFEPAPSDDMTTNCVGTLKLRHGQISVQGLLELDGAADPGPFPVAVVGGTGRYRGALGEAVAWQPRPPENEYRYTLEFDSSPARKR